MGVSNLEYYNDRYKGSLSDTTCEILEQLIELGDATGCVPDLSHIIYQLHDSDVMRMIDTYDESGIIISDFERPLGTLEDYQTIGVAFMYYSGSCILGDSVGMGKTVETAGLCNLLSLEYAKMNKQHRYLFLTEKKPVTQVRSKLIKFTGEYVHLLRDSTQKSIDYLEYVAPYNSLLENSLVGTHNLIKASGFISWMNMYTQHMGEPPFDTLFVDESSILGGTNTDFVKNFKVIKKFFKRIYFLNATPIDGSLRVFYNQLDLLDSKFLPTRTNFNKEYVVMNYTGMFPKPTNRYKNKEQFKKCIRYRYYASTRKSNGAVMDDCSGDILVSPLSKAQRKLLKETQLNSMVYDCPSYLDPSIPFDDDNVPKLASLNELLKGECADADTIIIYVHFREAQYHLSEWLTSKGVSNRILNGATKLEDSNKIIDGFKNSEYRVLITNIQKGLDFGNCDYCIFYGFDANPAKMVQFEGRMTRSFDIIGKHVYILCSLGGEYNNLKKAVADKANAMTDMSTTDYSVVLSIFERFLRKKG